MGVIRSEAVKLAKQMGLCTQCMKHKAEPERFQCTRCIETNHRKWFKRRSGRMKQKTKEARAKGICTKCLKSPAKEGRAYCEPCLEADKNRQRKNRGEGKRTLSPEHRQAISDGRARAFAKKDTGEKRHYSKRVKTPQVQMQGMINELELFISRLPNMTASEYLEARVNLINSILLRGRKI